MCRFSKFTCMGGAPSSCSYVPVITQKKYFMQNPSSPTQDKSMTSGKWTLTMEKSHGQGTPLPQRKSRNTVFKDNDRSPRACWIFSKLFLFASATINSKSFIRDDVGCVGFCQERFRATRLWLENLEKSQVTEWMYLPLCTSVNLNPFLHCKSNPCLNGWTSGWLGGSEPMTALYSTSAVSASWAFWSRPWSCTT